MVINKIKTPLIYTIGINKSQALRLSGYMMLLAFLGAGLFSSITGSGNNGALNPVVAIIVFFATPVAHEAVHGFFFKVFGGNPKYGFSLIHYFFPVAYATSPGQPYTLGQMTVIAMSPFFVVCTLAVVIAIIIPSTAPYAALAFLLNFAGAVGDMWLLRQLWCFRKVKNLAAVDTKTGLEVYGTGDKAKPGIAKLQKLDNPNATTSKITTVWIKSLLVIFLLTFLAGAALGQFNFSGHILVGPSQFPLFEYVSTDKIESTLAIPPILVASLIFSVLYIWIRNKKPLPNT